MDGWKDRSQPYHTSIKRPGNRSIMYVQCTMDHQEDITKCGEFLKNYIVQLILRSNREVQLLHKENEESSGLVRGFLPTFPTMEKVGRKPSLELVFTIILNI